MGAAVAAAVGACGVESGGDPTQGCTDDARSAGEPGEAEPLLILGSARFAPTIVYADGAVVIPTSNDAVSGAGDAAGFLRVPMMMPGYSGEEPGGFTAGWLSDCELQAVTGAADELFTDGLDFGMPQITDSGSTQVTYGGSSDSVYAFNRNDPDQFDDLSTSQRQARQDLADLWDAVENATEVTGVLEIDRLFVVFYGSLTDAEVSDWPLSTPVSELSKQDCVALTDPTDVQLMLDRLEQDEPMIDESDWRLSVVAAAPGVPDCEG